MQLVFEYNFNKDKQCWETITGYDLDGKERRCYSYIPPDADIFYILSAFKGLIKTINRDLVESCN